VRKLAGMPLHEAALWWIVYRSALGENDCVLFGNIEKGTWQTKLVKVSDEACTSLNGTRGGLI